MVADEYRKKEKTLKNRQRFAVPSSMALSFLSVLLVALFFFPSRSDVFFLRFVFSGFVIATKSFKNGCYVLAITRTTFKNE